MGDMSPDATPQLGYSRTLVGLKPLICPVTQLVALARSIRSAPPLGTRWMGLMSRVGWPGAQGWE